jgi:hypothetical protein
MIIKNKLDKTFGPFGESAGFFLFLGGVAMTWFSMIGLIVAAFGSFAAFTTTSTYIDTDKKKIKFSNDIFGFIHMGNWIDIKPDMKLVLRRIHRGYRAYTRANQPIGIHTNDIRIILCESDDDEIMQIKKFSNREEAVNGINFLSAILGLSHSENVML